MSDELIGNVPIEGILAHLCQGGVRHRRDAWIIIGGALTTLELESAADSNGVPWLHRVADALEIGGRKLGFDQIRKMGRVYSFLQEISPSISPSMRPEHFSNASVSAIEIARRIYSLDREKGIDAVKKIIKGAGVRETQFLYEKYLPNLQNQITAKQSALIERQLLLKPAVEFITQNPSKIFGPHNKFKILEKQKTRSEYGVQLDLIASVEFSEKEVDRIGFQMMLMIGSEAIPTWRRIRPSIAFSSSFYRMMWIFASVGSEEAKIVVDGIMMLDLKNIGFAALDEEKGSFNILLSPTDLPVPDRRHLQ